MQLKSVNPYASACPSRPVIDLIGAKWTILLFGLLTEGVTRFSQFAERIEGITPKELTRKLRQLERTGLVKRTVHPVIPPRVDYELTELGQSLRGPIEAIISWTDDHIAECVEAQRQYDAAHPV